MTVYKDLDISLNRNIYNDFSVITDKDSIINTFKNNLLIDPDEKYFDNSNYLSLKSVLHTTIGPVEQEFIEECVEKAIEKDERIEELVDLNYSLDSNNYTLTLEVIVKINLIVDQNVNRIIDFTVVVTRS